MPEIHIHTKKSVTLENSEHDPITLNGLHEFLKQADSLKLHGDTVVEFESDDLNDTENFMSRLSATENSTEGI